jgi:protein-tyrosine phosphatase
MNPGGFADLHQHVLWGLDDGPGTAEQMYALLEQSAAEGIRLVYATTHADPQRRPFDLALYRARLGEANAYCEKKGLDLHILPGCEIKYSASVPDRLAAGRLLPLGASRHVLVEFAPDVSLYEICEAADSLYRAGYLPVLAHVERYRCLRQCSFPEKAMNLREEYGLFYQMNCAAAVHPHGLMERRFVHRMLTAQAIDVIATDAHDTVLHPAKMREAYRTISHLCGEDYAKCLTEFGWQLVCIEVGEEA